MRDIYMVVVNSGGAVFVKELEFFRSQGGFVMEWGQSWVPVVATSIEDARRIGCEKLPGAKPYTRQAGYQWDEPVKGPREEPATGPL